MKKIFLLCLAMFSFSCSNDDEQPQKIKVIDTIKLKITDNNGTEFYELNYEYDNQKLISKIDFLDNGEIDDAIDFKYDNGVPKSCDDGLRQFVFEDEILKKLEILDTDITCTFTFDQPTKTYASTCEHYFAINTLWDITTKPYYTNILDYSYDDTGKKGPFYNLPNKNFMSATIQAVRFANNKMFFQSIYPVNGFFDNNNAVFIPFMNQYDEDGFVIQSDFTDNNNSTIYTISYTYKNI
ncbi:conserved exported hypothetical protein [Flavobacterium sp. 9AF]|uniref:hypothetical protein n=1 Tax=Flavobacterium sp. 9AF TaxID=2653142 RepID=UPI0012EF1CB7|nr:hypothetical protein [Flavobacterium sp. 9AF]VXB34461.1 conserved exported hypothetical protein [Flavobacterium sp. 9AF]